MRIVFMGTPDIAATCLNQLIEENMDVVAVYTQPDRPKGRGMKMLFSPVKERALAAGIPVYQPENFRDPDRGGGLRTDPASDGAGYSAQGLCQHPCQCSAFLPWLCALPVGSAGRTEGNRCDGHVSVRRDGCRQYH